ncbi:MAG: glycosyltransferase [Nitrospirae bacterium]|nr:glycosyltransferase [Nitrospirota bacterium]
MKKILILAIIGFNYCVGFYFGLLNTVYSVLLVLALFMIFKHLRRIKYSPYREFSISPETPPVTILIAMHNEEKVVLRSIRSALATDYPFFEVIIINDGSTDGTLQKVIDTYGLKKIDRVYRTFLKTQPVKGFYYSLETPNFLVIDKERGGKADALNCGVNVSRSPYFCSLDADSLFEKDALIRVMAPLLESNIPVIASGGVVRIINGLKLTDGLAIEEIDLPDSTLLMFQIVEYIRGFLFGRVGWDSLHALLIISGTFSLFQKASVVEAGGFTVGNVAEDMEMIVRLHRTMLKKKKPYRIRFVSDPICWTEAPDDLTMLGRQRRRWHLGLIQSIYQNREMMFNPQFGKIGMGALPYYLLFEILGPVIEVLGYVCVITSYFLGILSLDFLLLFLTLAIFYGVFLSTAGIFLEELTFRRYPKWSHLFKLLIYGVFENFGYRQINSFWRFEALILYIMGRRKWELVHKKGQEKQAPADAAGKEGA